MPCESMRSFERPKAPLSPVEVLPNTPTARTLGNQLLRCGTSVAANYRAACRAKSKADFISKMTTVEEEADESIFWLEMLVDASLLPLSRLKDLKAEGEEILKIVVGSINTARGGRR